jgi:hypothetical protein
VADVTFAELVNEGMRRKGWKSDYQLSSAIGLLAGDRSFNATQVRRLREGRRRGLTPELVARIAQVLEFTPQEEEQAWNILLEPLGLTREDLTDEGFQRFRGAAHELIGMMRRLSRNCSRSPRTLLQAA